METGIRWQQASSHIWERVRRNLFSFSVLALVVNSQILGVGQNPGSEDKGPSQATVAEIPFKLCNNNLIVVKGNVGSVSGVKFVLDTGTSRTSISKALAIRLKLSGSTEPLQTLSGPIETQSVVVPDIQIGAFLVDRVRVLTQDFKFLEDSLGESIGGILGLDVLRSHNFTIDYRKKRITFVAAETANSTQLESQGPLLTVNVKIGDQSLRFIVDSGAQGLIAFRNRIKEPSGILRSVQGTFISTVAGIPRAKFFRTFVALGEDRREQTVTIADVEPGPETDFDGLLGFVAMGFQRVSFDFERGTIGWDLNASESSHSPASRFSVPWLGCGTGLEGEHCQMALEAVSQALHQLNPHLAGWRVIVVPDNQWQTTSAAFAVHDSVPAFSNLPMASTYLNAELIFPDNDTDMKLLGLTRLTGMKRLQWVLAHEYGHIVCRTHEEAKAARAGDYLLRGQIGSCS